MRRSGDRVIGRIGSGDYRYRLVVAISEAKELFRSGTSRLLSRWKMHAPLLKPSALNRHCASSIRNVARHQPFALRKKLPYNDSTGCSSILYSLGRTLTNCSSPRLDVNSIQPRENC
jgi:hypothetical protein